MQPILLALLVTLLSNGCHGAPVEWDYKAHNPSTWPGLFKKWCGARLQSPIQLAVSEASYDGDMPAYAVSEPSLSGAKFQTYNDGHKIVVLFSVDFNVSIPGHAGSCFRPQSVHWHWGADDGQGSEHWIEGRRYPMEGHIVMWNCQFYTSFAEALDGFGGLAVLGLMYEPDTAVTSVSPGLSTLLGMMSATPQLQQCPECKNESFAPPLFDMNPFSLSDLLPSDRSEYYLYGGSLTTPDCRENVMWTVYRQSIRVPPSFLAAFRSLKFPDGTAMVNNYRPPLPLNPFNPFGPRRLVVRSFSTGSPAPLPRGAAMRRASPAGVAGAVFAVAVATIGIGSLTR